MKSIIQILSLVLSIVMMSSCEESSKPLDYFNFFKETRLLSDSINLELKMNQAQIINTTEGELEIKFEAGEICPINEDVCGSCDPEAVISMLIKHEKDSVSLPRIYLYRCSLPFAPISYGTIDCDEEVFGYHFTHYENMIYNVRELTPYPHTHEETNDFYYNSKYTLRLTILNKCE
jgi:hypothetical protein